MAKEFKTRREARPFNSVGMTRGNRQGTAEFDSKPGWGGSRQGARAVIRKTVLRVAAVISIAAGWTLSASAQNPCYHTQVWHPLTGTQPGYVCPPSVNPLGGGYANLSAPTPGVYGYAGQTRGRRGRGAWGDTGRPQGQHRGGAWDYAGKSQGQQGRQDGQ